MVMDERFNLYYQKSNCLRNGMVFVSQAISHAECSLKLKKSGIMQDKVKQTFFKVD